MGAGAGEVDLAEVLAHLVNQQPVGFDMAFPVPDKIPLEGVVPEPWLQGDLLDEEFRHPPELGLVLAASLGKPHVPVEPGRVSRVQAHRPRLLKKASLSVNRRTPLPLAESRSARRVVALGVRSMAISNGRPLVRRT